MSECEHIAEQLSGYIDNELTQQQRQRVELHIEACEQCAQLANQLEQMQQSVGRMQFPEPSEAELERIMGDEMSQHARVGGWILLILAAVVVAGIVFYAVFVDPATPWFIKLLYGSLIIGGGLLFGSVLRQRLIARKTDKYRRVKL